MTKFSDYPGDPPEPQLRLSVAYAAGICDYCGYPYKAGEVVDVSGTMGLGAEVMVMCQACIEEEQPGATQGLLNPPGPEPEVDGDAFDDAAFVDGDGDGFSALLQPKPGKASEFHD